MADGYNSIVKELAKELGMTALEVDRIVRKYYRVIADKIAEKDYRGFMIPSLGKVTYNTVQVSRVKERLKNLHAKEYFQIKFKLMSLRYEYS